MSDKPGSLRRGGIEACLNLDEKMHGRIKLRYIISRTDLKLYT